MWRRRDADRPGGPGSLGLVTRDGRGGFVADCRLCVRIERAVNGNLPEKLSLNIKDLDAAIATIGNVDAILSVDRDAVRSHELAGFAAGLSPGCYPVALLVDLGDPGVDVAIADVGVARRVPGDVGHLAEHALNGRQRRLEVLPRCRRFVGCFLLAPKDHGDATLWRELNDHVGAFVCDPDVVVFVDLDRVGKGPSVEVATYLAKEFPVGSELQQLSSARSIRR